jgi:hypothetical protein
MTELANLQIIADLIIIFLYLNFLNSRASLRGNEPIPFFHSVRWGTRRALGPTAVSQFWPLELFHPITCFIDEYLISNFSSTICVMFGLLIDNMLQDYIRCWHLQGGPLISLLSIFNTEKPTFCTYPRFLVLARQMFLPLVRRFVYAAYRGRPSSPILYPTKKK